MWKNESADVSHQLMLLVSQSITLKKWGFLLRDQQSQLISNAAARVLMANYPSIIIVLRKTQKLAL